MGVSLEFKSCMVCDLVGRSRPTPFTYVKMPLFACENGYPWYPAAGIRSNKIRTAGADERTGQQRSSPLHPKAGGTSLDEIHDLLFLSEKSVPE